MGTPCISLQLLDHDEFQALEIAIAAAESSALSNKKPKISASDSPLPSSSATCNSHTETASAIFCEARISESGNSSGFTNPGSKEEKVFSVSARSAEAITAAQGGYLQSDSRNAQPIDSEGGSSLTGSREIVFLKVASPSGTILADGLRIHIEDVGYARVNNREVSNADSDSVVLNPNITDKLLEDPCSSHSGYLHENSQRQSHSSRRLPCWERPAGSRKKENSSSSGLAEIKPRITHGDENGPASILELPEALSVDHSRLPWGLTPPTCKVVTKCKLPSLQFKGRINYSDTVLDAENAAHELLSQVEAKKAANGGLIPLGFDTEWKVVFRRGAQRRKVAVLQLCIDAENCNVFHVIHSGIPSTLKNILEDPLVSKVGVGAYGDAAKLCTDYNVKVKGIKDLSGLANSKLVGASYASKSWSLSSLAEELLGKQVDKTGSIRMGDWEVEKLSEAQLQYAATDAFASLYLFQVLQTFPNPPKEETILHRHHSHPGCST